MSIPRVFRALQSSVIAAAAILSLPNGALAQTAPAPAPQRTATVPATAKPKPAPLAAVPQGPAGQTTATQQVAAAKASGGDDIVARVGNANISAEELRAYVGALGVREQAALAKDPALLSQTVRMLLANRLVLQELTAKKWDQRPTIAAQLDRVRENALVELYLQSVSTPANNYPGEEDLQKVYEANRSALLVPRQFQLAQIFVAAPKDADKASEDKAKKKLDDIQARLKALNADFIAIARAEGEAKNGGDLGWLAENQIRPEIRTQVIGLVKNGVSDPIRLEDGWHILKLLDTKAAYTRTLPEVREQLVQQMRSEHAAMMRRAYLAELLKEHPPILNELALSNLLDGVRK
ncbi:peptidylprolyl isomerase [Bradyrhizobium sp. sGM-13]|uniref:peptidylprolyl isomerase n=1 Tax=Bradyrhizobium sp. sGM-13 TaxID=2831781 RepID=UPI001BCDB9F6|nr:peptidylprolyl isomerase [Bradyrhizobium sp. sGM-13]